MSDTPPPVWTPGPPGDAAAAGALSPEAIDRVLADFRTWLTDLAAVPPPPAEPPPAVDLHTLVAQFTALRHEVNLQTKSARSSLEQTGDALGQLRDALDELRDRPESDDGLTPLLKAVVDVYDNLALALRQAERQREAIEPPLADVIEGIRVPEPRALPEPVPAESSQPQPGFLARLFGRPSASTDSRGQHTLLDWREGVVKELAARRQRTADAANLVRSSLDGLIAGYRMSLARVDRVLDQYGLEPIAAVGEKFDPELMEVVEVAADTGRPAGEVIEEVRRGYLRDDVVFRYAQVKVAR